MLGPRVVLAQVGQRHAPACPGVSQRRARSASGPWTARATVRRASDRSKILFYYSLRTQRGLRKTREKHFMDRLVLSKHVHTRFISCSRGVDRLHVPRSRFRIAKKVSWDVHGQQVNPDALPDSRFFRKNRNILVLKSATCKFSNETNRNDLTKLDFFSIELP
jgi:hypothetical protein